jgi:hypothetical protein
MNLLNTAMPDWKCLVFAGKQNRLAMMMMPDKAALSCIKSRFTGFFAFLLLSACQPATDKQSELMQRAKYEPAAAVSLASQRLAAGEYPAALRWFRHAASLGDPHALQHALRLQQREQGRLATATWLQQQFDHGVVTGDVVSPGQRAELGLWQQLVAPASEQYRHAQGCQLTLQPVVSQQAGVDTWQSLLAQWRGNAQLSQLAVCFLPVVAIDSPDLACSEDNNTLLQCNYTVLSELVAAGRFSQLLVIAGRGKASYNNGILQLPDNADLALLQHEFMHVLGFIDEYQLNSATAARVCQTGSHYPNVVIGQNVAAYLQQWQLNAEDIRLTPVSSCSLTPVPAYSVVNQATLMRSYELALPALYLELAMKVLRQPERLMPVQYYFAYLARQQQNWRQWHQFMQLASDWGYADAQQALALGFSAQ